MRMRALIFSLLLTGTATARAEVATRLADLAAGTASGVPELHAAVFQNKLYFRASDDGTTFDLWVYDGVNPPVQVPGGAGLDPKDPVVWAGELYFNGTGGNGQVELWRFDGATDPEQAVDLYAAGSGNPRRLFPWNAAGLLCYQVQTAGGVELGCWDGVNPPVVHALGSGLYDGYPIDFALLGDQLIFGANTFASTRKLFAFDGQSAPVVVSVDGTHPGNPHEMTVADGVVYFWASAPGTNGARVWKWDGSAVPPEPFGPAGIAFPAAMTLFRGRPHLYIGQGGYGVWRVDTDGLTRLSGDAIPYFDLEVTAAGPAIFYVADGDLVRYCGTETTPRVTGQFSAPDGPRPGRTVAFDGRLWFAARQAASTGDELWSIPLVTRFCDGFVDADLAPWSTAEP